MKLRCKNFLLRNRIYYNVFYFLVFCCILLNISYATKIVAVVGDSAITNYEVDQRTKMIAMIRGYDLKKDEHLINEIQKEIINMLIDEQIKKTFAENAKMNIKPEMIDQFILEYGKKGNKTSMQEVRDLVDSYGIDWDFFRSTVADEIAWSQLVYFGLSRSVQFSEEEILQRATAYGIDPSDESSIAKVKEEMLEERLTLDVQKMISKMKRFRVAEAVE